ncbi:SnoaL-like polyketide cyclase [Phyllobacterium sp. CL33Tsu]|uniref:ester cyclase n=1 Tax=Phyllobacterium sp. CL33Tsu TaxID=1798191 RepID=UPI0008ECBE0A|nr:ester cyclase [Phyllobacterium sp. CL33Tsu]SFI98066.1 SnoaL-like polyketide cyclase [Phyllobacterium sp. CL33Tsu]
MNNYIVVAFAALTIGLPAQAYAEDPAKAAEKALPALMEELAKYQNAEKTTDTNLKTFDTLDFDVYTNQKWDRLGESHAADILVHYPDGHTTKGLHDHVEELKAIFVYAPDTHINVHPVRFGQGQWTGVIGVMEGTFTKPMPTPDGKSIAPTGKPFKLTMATLGHWTPAAVMDEEYLFWDNLSFMKQIGLAQ